MKAEAGRYTVAGSATWMKVFPHTSLLQLARTLAQQGFHSQAVITAQTACEVYTEAVITRLIRARGIADLHEAIDSMIPNYNLANERVRRLYDALSSDRIQETEFWQRFKTHVERRHEAAHQGKGLSADVASASCQVAEELIRHLESVLNKMKRRT
jgi:hypothetical protein